MYTPLCGEELELQSYPNSPTGRPYPPKSACRTRGTPVYTPLCGEELEVQSWPTPPPDHPYPLNRPGSTGETRVYPPLCGEELEIQSYTAPPRGGPIPQTAHAGPQGVGCIRRCVGRRCKLNHTRPPRRPSLSPKRSRHERRDSAVSAVAW